jgi:hypothetical protein
LTSFNLGAKSNNMRNGLWSGCRTEASGKQRLKHCVFKIMFIKSKSIA